MNDLNNSIIHRSAVIAHHAKSSRRIEMIQGDYEFVICNYDGLNLIATELNNDGRFDLVIVDEANAYKTTTTKRWKTLQSNPAPQHTPVDDDGYACGAVACGRIRFSKAS